MADIKTRLLCPICGAEIDGFTIVLPDELIPPAAMRYLESHSVALGGKLCKECNEKYAHCLVAIGVDYGKESEVAKFSLTDDLAIVSTGKKKTEIAFVDYKEGRKANLFTDSTKVERSVDINNYISTNGGKQEDTPFLKEMEELLRSKTREA